MQISLDFVAKIPMINAKYAIYGKFNWATDS